MNAWKFKNASLLGFTVDSASSHTTYAAKVSFERLGGVGSSAMREREELEMSSVRKR